MSNLAKIKFVAHYEKKNTYLGYQIDAEIHLPAKGLEDSIKDGNKASNQDKTKATIFHRHHLHEGLKLDILM